jgi:hypothetical protein
MPGKYPGLRALIWHFNGYYDRLDVSIHFRYPTGIIMTRVLYIVMPHPLASGHLKMVVLNDGTTSNLYFWLYQKKALCHLTRMRTELVGTSSRL